MAQIDSSIALGVKPVQIENPLAVQGRAMEGAVNALKMREMEQTVQDRNALRQLDPTSKDYISQVGRINPKLALELQEGRLKTKKLTGEIDEQAIKLHRERVADLAFNPSDNNILAHLEDGVLKGNITTEQAKQQWSQVGAMNPAQRKEYFTLMGVNAEKRLSDITTRRGQDISAQTTRRGQDLQYDPDLQAKIAGAKKRAETDVTQEVQGQADVKANRKALATAGYDPVTGKDNISKLIQESTGSFAGAGTDLAGRVFGISTKGAQAISQLKTFESKLTQDILGGKLGAGISNTDREFIVQAIGEIANSTLPVETRQAAWDAVKERMRVAGMVEAPKAPANNINVPGVGSQVNVPGGSAAPAAKPSLDDIFKPKK
jgi:hypothetical protein